MKRTLTERDIKNLEYTLNEIIAIIESYELSKFFYTIINDGINKLISKIITEYEIDNNAKDILVKLINCLYTLNSGE